jgi:ribosome-binding factor A
MTRRLERLSHLLRQELSQLIQSDLKDPLFHSGLISITEVDLSPDLRIARVFVSIYADREQKQQIFESLKTASGYLRRHLAQRVVMRVMPELHFVLDESLARAAALTELIREVSSQRQPEADEH